MSMKHPQEIEIVEYPAKITTSHGTMTREALAEYNRAERERQEKHNAELLAAEAAKPKTDCPFNKSMHPDCNPACALYSAGACSIKRLAEKVVTEATESRRGAKCPFSAGRTCNEVCTLYINGACSIVALANHNRKDIDNE